MDTLDHKKQHSVSTGHEEGHEVHLCHRCGWPFPNPHPSSRHRRAHKRVCGTIKGYEIDQSKSAVSDDEHASDDDEHNPSPMVEKANSKEVVSSIGGVGKISIKSEDDVFSDAITEFPDGGISPQTENKSIERDFNSSQLKVVDETAERTELNDPAIIDQTLNSGAMVNAMDHFEGVGLITNTKLKPISVGHGNGLQPDIDELDNVNELGGDKGTEQELVKAKEEADMQKEGKLESSTLDCEEEKPSDPALVAAERKNLVAEVVKHDPSRQTDTFEEMVATKEVKTEVSDSIECSNVVPVGSFIEKEGDNGSFDLKGGETYAEKQVNAKLLKGGEQNGEEVAILSQEKIDSAMQSEHSTDISSDLYNNAENLEEVSKLESSLPEFRDNGIEMSPKELDSETPCDSEVKNDVKEVEPVNVAGIEPELKRNSDISESGRTIEQNGSEVLTLTKTSENELKHDVDVALVNENSEISSLSEKESSIEECSKEKLPSVEEHNTDDNAASENFSFTPVLDKSIASPLNFQVVHESSTAGDNNGENVSVDCKSLEDDGGDVNLKKENDGVSVMDHSTTKSDSQEGKCGSVSAVPEATLLADNSETNSQEPKTTTFKSDDFEPPSFMTLVDHASEIETMQQTTQHPKSEALRAGWFPSLTNVVNESEGRKKNEEKIAKVTKQYIPLKNLLSEAKSPNMKQIPSTFQKEEDSAKENGADVNKVNNSALDVEAGKEMDKEWDSPARYPIESEKVIKKKKGFWIPFACCSSSVH